MNASTVDARFGQFLSTRVNVGAADRDRRREALPRELLRAAADLGLFGAGLPRDVGGDDASGAERGRTLWRISYLCDELAFPFVVSYQQSLVKRILATGRADLVERYARPVVRGERFGSFCWTEGADAFSFRSSARRSARGLVVNGIKGPVSGGVFSDFFLVYAREPQTDDLVAVILERTDPGVEIAPLDPMGLCATGQAEVRFNDVVVDLDRVVVAADGVTDAQKFLNERRIAIPCMVLGRLEALFEATIRDLAGRQRYRAPLTEMQAIQAGLGRMSASLDAMRAMVERMLAALAHDEAARASVADEAWHPLVAATKYFVVEEATTFVRLAQHLLGGRWYYAQWPFGRWMRDVLGFIAAAGTQGILEVDLGVLACSEIECRAARKRTSAERSPP
jgi:alkylation response protein AidB-like acyl-CoA dehydrogenase